MRGKTLTHFGFFVPSNSTVARGTDEPNRTRFVANFNRYLPPCLRHRHARAIVVLRAHPLVREHPLVSAFVNRDALASDSPRRSRNRRGVVQVKLGVRLRDRRRRFAGVVVRNRVVDVVRDVRGADAVVVHEKGQSCKAMCIT